MAIAILSVAGTWKNLILVNAFIKKKAHCYSAYIFPDHTMHVNVIASISVVRFLAQDQSEFL